MSLNNQRVLITQALTQAAELRHKLEAAGAQPVLFPCIEISPGDTSALDAALGLISQFNWVLLDGPLSVAAFWARLSALELDERIFREQRFGVVGKAAARALTKHGPLAEFVADPEASLEAIGKMGVVRGQWVLMLQSAEWREPLGMALSAQGAVVREVSAYRTLPPAPLASGLADLQRGVAAIVFCEPMAVKNFVALVGREAAHRSVIICSGPTTAGVVRDLGLVVQGVASASTTDALIASVSLMINR